MEMLQRLKNTMSSAIPGNPLTRDYDVKKLVAVAGPGLYWKVFDAVKKTTKQESAVWLLEKRQLDRFTKSEREVLIEIYKKGISSLTRLRHPHILQVHQPLEESRESLAFATEPVFACLANIIQQPTAIESPNNGLNYDSSIGGQNVSLTHLRDYQLFETEKKYGFLQIGEALTFLHGDCHQAHGNICPQSIILARNGSWKLASFEFSQMFNPGNVPAAGSAKDCLWKISLSVPVWQSNFPSVGQPSLDYIAPEVIKESILSPAADLFSLGQLLYAIYNGGKVIFESHNDLSTYKKNIERITRPQSSLLQNLPENVRDYVKLMLSVESSLRPDANQFIKLPFFDDPGVTALLNMDNVYQLDNLAKSQFYKALPKTVIALPKRINVHRIFPQLAEEFVNANMVPFVLPSVLHIIDMVTENEFINHILPFLLPIFKIQEPIQVTLICLQNLPILMAKMPSNEFKNHLLPMLNRALECDNPQIQELCLKILPSVGHLIEQATLKNAVVPRLKRILLNAGVIQMKVKCLLCLEQMMEHMDKWFVLDEIIPMVSQMQSREPALLMSILGIFRVAFTNAKLGITKDHLATRCLPFLIPLCIESNLNLGQFDEFIQLIKIMLSRLETEHRSKLEQLHGLEQEQRSMEISTDSPLKSTSLSSTGKEQPGTTELNEIMSGFGFGGSVATKSNLLNGKSVLSEPTADPSLNATLSQTIKPMTLEEKQRLAQQKELMSRMQQSSTGGGVLTPMSSAPRPRAPPPKDLTSSLIDRNLSGIASTTPSLASGMSTQWNSSPFTNQQSATPLGTFGTGVRPMSLGMSAMSGMNVQPLYQSNFSTPFSQTQSTNNAAKPLSTTDIDDLLS